jgi:hypothetical protein
VDSQEALLSPPAVSSRRPVFDGHPAKPPLPDLCNLLDHSIITNWLIVAYHQPNNLRNLFFPQVFQGLDNHPISTFIPHPTGCEDMIV